MINRNKSNIWLDLIILLQNNCEIENKTIDVPYSLIIHLNIFHSVINLAVKFPTFPSFLKTLVRRNRLCSEKCYKTQKVISIFNFKMNARIIRTWKFKWSIKVYDTIMILFILFCHSYNMILRGLHEYWMNDYLILLIFYNNNYFEFNWIGNSCTLEDKYLWYTNTNVFITSISLLHVQF